MSLICEPRHTHTMGSSVLQVFQDFGETQQIFQVYTPQIRLLTTLAENQTINKTTPYMHKTKTKKRMGFPPLSFTLNSETKLFH